MSGGARSVVEVGGRVRFDERIWTAVVLEGAQVALVDEAGSVARVLLSHLVADPSFEVIGGTPLPRVPPFGLLESVPEEVREQAVAWERHVREVETGFPGPDAAGVPRPDFDPAQRSLAQREAAKAAELTMAGQATSVTTVRRMRARYRKDGLWGLIDQRATRQRSALGRADERVVTAIVRALEEQRERSTGTLSRLRRVVGWILDDTHGEGVVAVPPVATFNRLVHALADGKGLLGTAAQRRRHVSRPAGPFRQTVVLRPGEVVMLDSTPLDVMVVLADGVLGRVELTIALDVATRSICAAVLRPVGTSAVDAAVLLAQMATPMRMRPGWERVLAMERSVVPYERLVALDARLEGAAARPVITPETVVVDQGKVFVSSSFLAACGSLGVSVAPVPPANGPAKGQVERMFLTIRHRFSQYVAGYTGPEVAERGGAVGDEACWTLPQLQELWEEWLVADWQNKAHEGLRHPTMPEVALSPNEMWAALVGVCGYVPVPLSRDDFVELMPVKWLAINDYGIRLDYRTYDDKALNGYRREPSGRHPRGRWEVHHNPYDPGRIWVRLPGGFEEVPWINRSLVTMPFTDFTWQHVRSTVARRAGRVEHEQALARALDALLRRAGEGVGSRRERAVAARAGAAASLADGHRGQGASGADNPGLLGAPTLSFGLPGTFGAAGEDNFGLDEEDGQDLDEWAGAEDVLEGAAEGLGAQSGSSPSGATRPSRILDPRQEAALW